MMCESDFSIPDTWCCSGGWDFTQTPLRSLLYAIYEINREKEVDDVLPLDGKLPRLPATQATHGKNGRLSGAGKRKDLKKTKNFNPDAEASRARVLAEAMLNQRL